MKRGLLCPQCGKFESWEEIKMSNSWQEYFKEYVAYGAREDGDVEEVVEVCDLEHVKAKHECDFETYNYRAEEFEVEVLDDGTVNFVGEYWQDAERISGRMRICLAYDESVEENVLFAIPADEDVPKITCLEDFPGKELPFKETNLPHKTAFIDWKGRVFMGE